MFASFAIAGAERTARSEGRDLKIELLDAGFKNGRDRNGNYYQGLAIDADSALG